MLEKRKKGDDIYSSPELPTRAAGGPTLARVRHLEVSFKQYEKELQRELHNRWVWWSKRLSGNPHKEYDVSFVELLEKVQELSLLNVK